MKKHILLIISIIFITLSSSAQITKIRGVITDEVTKESIPFVSVTFLGTSSGTITDFEGTFFLEARVQQDTVVISCVGYLNDTITVNKFGYTEINHSLKENPVILTEIVVDVSVNPAIAMFKKVTKNRKRNNPERYKTYSYEQYNKMELDISNIDSQLADEKFMKQFKFVFNNIDTSASTGQTYLPVMISETLSEYHFQKRPKRRKEVIKATQFSGFENESISKFSGQMYLNINVYDNYIQLVEKQFVSPVAINGLLVYEYFLTDSMFIDDNWCYQMTYKPRRKHEYTFRGDMWIADTTFAVKKITARIDKDVNVDFIQNLHFKHKFEAINDSLWFPVEEELFIDFNISKKTSGFLGRKNTYRKNVKVNEEFPKGFFTKGSPKEIITAKDATKKDTAFWAENRHAELSGKEKNIYAVADSIQNIPAFRTVSDFVILIASGYYEFGWFEYGPFGNTYSTNAIEGHRFRVGGQTGYPFSKDIRLNGYLAYGTLDKKFKYGFGAEYKVKANQWTKLKVQYEKDLIQLGLSPNAFDQHNIMAVMLARTESNSLLSQKNFQIGLERDIKKGLTFNLNLRQRELSPVGEVQFIKNKESISRLSETEIEAGLRIAFNEEFMETTFSRMSLGTVYPKTGINVTYGFPLENYSDYEYTKIELTYEHQFFLGPIGKFQYGGQAGKIFGNVPFPLLKLHEGNETLIFDPYSYNMMYLYEFASDEYFGLYAEHHFQGLFLNKVPVIRKLKMREIAYAKGVIGRLSPENRDEFTFPGSLSDVSKPYMEVGAGLENILTFFRADVIWRLTHTDNENKDIQKYGFRLSLVLNF